MTEKKNIPQHVAIIMDGNGRWAKQRGRDRAYGHVNGVDSVRNAVKSSLRNGVRYLTLYAFSTENWGRPIEEINALMELLCQSIINEATELKEQGVAVKMIGDVCQMSAKVQQHLQLIESQTSAGDKLTLILALNYSSRWEITEAVKQIAREVASGKLADGAIDAQTISDHLSTRNYPDPDLVIRTSGEARLSNFLLWQSAYSELYFTEVLWPDFDQEQYDKAIESYQNRERRYGLVIE